MLKQVLDPITPYNRVVIVRSLVSTREIGFLPGDHDDKAALYQIPYKNMVKYMFELPTDSDFEMLWGNLKTQESVKFWSTSFVRGTTLDDCIMIVDECQNLNFHELDSIITRVGENCKIPSWYAAQTDLVKTNEKNGILDFMKILSAMPEFDSIEFGIEDIVRSGLVKSYILNKLAMSIDVDHVECDLPALSGRLSMVFDTIRLMIDRWYPSLLLHHTGIERFLKIGEQKLVRRSKQNYQESN